MISTPLSRALAERDEALEDARQAHVFLYEPKALI